MNAEWKRLYIQFTQLLSAQSKDSKIQVGCVLTSTDGQHVYAVGVNGGECGGLNERESIEQGRSGFVHAEQNALIKSSAPHYVSKTLFVNILPCVTCARMIVNAGGVDEVVYAHDYGNVKDVQDILTRAGITMSKVIV